MWKDKEVHFADDYMFRDAALAADATAQVSEAFELGCTLGGIRVHGWLVGEAACASGNTVETVLEVADTPDAADWREIASNTVTATGTALSGDIFSFVPDVAEHYMRVKVSNSAGMTGTFSVAPELIP